MKIKTITCHDVYNAGAKLQCFALSKWFENQGHDVEIIDYRPYYLTSAYKLFGVNNPRYRGNPILSLIYIVAHLPKKLKKLKQRRAYDRFSAKYLKYTPTQYTKFSELQQNPPQADLFVAGSDQIWNTLFPNGKDSAFYLDFASDSAVKSSYAASFATPNIEPQHMELVTNYLKRLDHISVRERSGLQILAECGVDGGEQVVDPVFLFSADEWRNMLDIPTIDDNYILVYDFDGSPNVERSAKQLAKHYDCKIYSIQDLGYSDRVLDDIDPIGFLSYIIGAKSTVSNSFHATAFSLIFHKDFWLIPRNEDINTRMEDLLTSVELSRRVIKASESITFEDNIEWHNVDKKLQIDTLRSTGYLNMVLESANKRVL